MFRRGHCTHLIWFFSALFALMAPEVLAAPEVRAVPVSGGITLDGILAESQWEDAPWQSGFVNIDRNLDMPEADIQTRFKVVYTPSSAYVAVECDEPSPAKIQAKTPWRDGAVWQDDCIEVFFDPGNEGRYYHQVMVNSKGVIFDLYAADYGLVKSRLWNGAFRAAGSVDADANVWRVELEIPFGALVLPQDAGSTWRWNVTRERHAGGATELTSWSPLQGNFHQPLKFGTVRGMPGTYRAFRLTLSEPACSVARAASGRVRLGTAMSVTNDTGEACSVLPTAWLLGQPDQTVTADPVELSPGESAEVSFPPLTFRAKTSEAQVVFSFADAAGGLLRRRVLKQVSSEYRPVDVTVLKPCYRGSIYATQAVEEVQFRVSLAPTVLQSCAAVHCRFEDAAGEVLVERRVTVGELEQPVTLGIGEIPIGEYALIVEPRSADGKVIARDDTSIRRLAPPEAGVEVRVDRDRNVLIDGEPFFGIGWYGGVPKDDPREHVVALQNLTIPVVLRYPDVSGIRRDFEEHGIRSVVSVQNGRLYHSFNLWQDKNKHLRHVRDECHTLSEPSDDTKRLVRQLVEAVRGEPGLLGYYIADEPEIHNIPSEYLENYYAFLREVDPYHPVIVTNDTIDGLVTHGYRCSDILSPDPYSAALDYVPNFLKKINEIWRPGQTIFVTPWHSTSQTHFKRPYGSAPPYDYRTFRNQYFASICYGAKGFTPYTSAFFMPEYEYRYGLPHVWRELRFLEPAILASPPDESVQVDDAPGLAVWAREVGRYVYVLAVNHTEDELAPVITWSPLGNRALHVMSEGRQMTAENGRISDSLASGDVRVYTDDPGALGLPTTEAVEAELAGRVARSRKAGNLLHVSRGTTVSSSDGYYAPWFHQYYYYVANGIEDDVGWAMHRSSVEEAWVEVALPETAAIGRIEMYTPTVRDYRIELSGPDGTWTAEFSGNTKAHVVHRLPSPVSCLKVRVTVTAVNGHDARPSISELEAYADTGAGPTATFEHKQASLGKAEDVLFAATTDAQFLWVDDFTDFASAPKYYWDERDTKWVLNPESFLAEPRDGGGIVTASISGGWSAMTHLFPYASDYRFFQVKLAGIEGKGYRFTNVRLGATSGGKGYRGCINTSRPGLYTVDAHSIHESYRDKRSRCYLVLGSAGSKREADGSVQPGPRFTFDWLRLASQPVNGLAVTLSDGQPLPEVIRTGHELHFEVHLQEPAQDVTVEALADSSYRPLAINGEPYVQLRRADADGHLWVRDVAIGPGTTPFKLGGYPVLFRAKITGGPLPETYASAFVSVLQ